MSSFFSGITDLSNWIMNNQPQRANRYQVDIYGGPNDIVLNKFFAKSVQIPERTITFFPDSVGPYIPNWKIPLKQQYDDRFLIEFMLSKDWVERRFIEKWMDIVLGTTINGIKNTQSQGSPYYNGKTPSNLGSIEITPVRADNQFSNFSFILEEVYPKMILPSVFDTNNQDFLTMTVDFSYRYITYNYSSSQVTQSNQ